MDSFEERALSTFYHQRQHNRVYQTYLSHILKTKTDPTKLEEIPFLPIEFFKTKNVKTGDWSPEKTFTSSGTSGHRSTNEVKVIDNYLTNTQEIFSKHFGPVSTYCHLALLPGYLEQTGSSLVSMVNHFVKESEYKGSAFFLDKTDKLRELLLSNIENRIPTVLWGVSFALLAFSENYQLPKNELMVIETGGMKGRRKEITREELHSKLKKGMGTDTIISEYGMTELFSQSYAVSDGLFQENDQFRVFIRPLDDPFGLPMIKQRGRIEIVDLANENTCAFIATQDIGIKMDKSHFKVLGRVDNSDIRGCNLMV